MNFVIKTVTVNGIVAGTDLNGKTAYQAVMDAATANDINTFDVFVDGEEYGDGGEIMEVGSDWTEIKIETSEKPSWV